MKRRLNESAGKVQALAPYLEDDPKGFIDDLLSQLSPQSKKVLVKNLKQWMPHDWYEILDDLGMDDIMVDDMADEEFIETIFMTFGGEASDDAVETLYDNSDPAGQRTLEKWAIQIEQTYEAEGHDPRGRFGTMTPEMEKPEPRILKKILNQINTACRNGYDHPAHMGVSIKDMRVWSFRPSQLKAQSSTNKAAAELYKILKSHAEHDRQSGGAIPKYRGLNSEFSADGLFILVYSEDYAETSTGYPWKGNTVLFFSGKTGEMIDNIFDIRGLTNTGRIKNRPRARDAMPGIGNRIR